jgi:hypothetical protein
MQACHELYHLRSCVVLRGCKETVSSPYIQYVTTLGQDTNVLDDRHFLTLIKSFFVIDGQLQGDRTKIRWHVLDS